MSDVATPDKLFPEQSGNPEPYRLDGMTDFIF